MIMALDVRKLQHKLTGGGNLSDDTEVVDLLDGPLSPPPI